jgi:hypothetical protein
MLYARGWSEFEAVRDVTISEEVDVPALPVAEKEADAVAGQQQPVAPKWLLKKGQRIVAAHWLASEGEEVWKHGEDGFEDAIALALQRRKF